MTRNSAAGLFAISLWTAVALGGTVYVDDDAPGDPGPGNPLISDPLEDGSAAHPFDALQEALNAAQPGDEIVVADGTYTGSGNRDLDFHGKAVTLRSASGDPTTCVIDCGHAGRAFYFHSGETSASVVNGFTLYNGIAGAGGGAVYCLGSAPTLLHCIITYSWSGSYGGAVYASGNLARPTLIDCRLTGNTAHAGGGLYGDSGSWATLIDCTIRGNTATYGGGLYLRSIGRVVLTGCQILANTASGGGGLYCYQSANPMLTNCTLGGNLANQSGGAVLCTSSSSPTLVNCALVGNMAASDGAGVQCRNFSNPRIVNCTITANSADLAGGISCGGYSSRTVTNCILWDNAAVAFNITSGDPVVTYCLVPGGWGGDGNIDAEPFFRRPPTPGGDGHWGTLDDDYGDLRLTAGSQCIDAGDNVNPPLDPLDLNNNGCTTEPLPIDLDNNARYVDDPDTPDTGRGVAPMVDIGAYEFGSTSALPPRPCPGDVNCDGAVDMRDVTAFVLALSDPARYEYMYPDCALLSADLNNDGLADFGDINPFVAVLSTR
jgi:hypothetical protein